MRTLSTRRLLLFGLPLALWFVVTLVAVVHADDCGRYMRNPTNLVRIPKSLIEDCMRTGVAQAVTTGTVAGIAGGAIANAVAQALAGAGGKNGRKPGEPEMKPPRDYGPGRPDVWTPPPEKQQQMWEKEGVVWDPETLSWRPPKPGEIPRPPDAPEKPPPYEQQQARDKTPVDCLGLYDRYVKAQSRALELQAEINAASERYWEAQRRHNANLAKFTLTLGWDVGSLLGAGVSGVHDAAAITRPGGLGPADTWSPTSAMGRALEAAKTRLAGLLERLRRLTDEVRQLGERVASLRQTAENLAQSARSLMSKVEELTGLVSAAEKRLTQAKEYLGIARRVDGLLAARNAIVEKLTAAEQRLKNLEQFWDRKFRLQMWEQGEKSAFQAQTTAAFNRLTGEIEQIEREIAQLRAARGAVEEGRIGKLLMRQRELEMERSRVTSRSWQEFAAERDPASFQAWKLEVEGTDPWTESAKELGPARKEVLDLRGQEALVEKQIGELRDQMPRGTTSSALEAEISAAEHEAQTHRSALEAARRESESARLQADEAARGVREAEGERNARELELQQVKKEVSDAQTEVSRLSSGMPVEPSLAEQLKPQFVKDFESGVKNALVRVGTTWEHLFGGQSPEKVARILKEGHDAVQRLLDELKAKQAEYDQATDDLRTLKPQLDQCIEAHTYYTGSDGR